VDPQRYRPRRGAASEALTNWIIVAVVKTGLIAACFLVVLGASAIAVAQTPGTSDAPASETAEVSGAGTPTVDGEPTQASGSGTSTRSEPEAAAEIGGSEHADEQFGHGMQLGLRAGLTGGYRMIFRYDKSPFCHAPDLAKSDKDQQKFCGNGAPLATEIALSFGVVDFAEPYAWARFGLGGEASTNTEALVAFGVGARIYTMSDSKFKIFVEPAVGMEFEGGAGNKDWVFRSTNAQPEYKTDFLFHLAVGPQYDFARAFGIYLNAGLTTGVLRYIHTQLEITGGAQVRVP
jgi:opacity protein-like surface antigen